MVRDSDWSHEGCRVKDAEDKLWV